MIPEFETDWLASRPVFYNKSTNRVSHCINDVIDFSKIEFDPEGFNNYLDFGYSVLGQTPIRDVKFLPPCSRLTRDSSGELHITPLPDPYTDQMENPSSEDDVWQRLEASIRQWERSHEGDIVLPLSGGYDSRLLSFFLADKSRICAFTYGTSSQQEESYEVVYARELASRSCFQWEQLQLGDYNQHLDQWIEMFGASTHAHGMYHIEFYNHIADHGCGGRPVLSGIVGDLWAGSMPQQDITRPADLLKLGYRHGLHADSKFSLLSRQGDSIEAFWELNKNELKEQRFQTLTTIRFKMMLLSYLLRVPDSLGFEPWSPFLDPHVALSMLRLPANRRAKRVWQRDFLQENNLDLESLGLTVSYEISLDQQANQRVPLKPLRVDTLQEVVDRRYVHWINRIVCRQNVFRNVILKMLRVRYIGGALRRVGLSDQALRGYAAYMTLKPIETLLLRRNLAE